MKAIVQDRYGSADVLELREIPTPTPAADELLIRVRAAGVDPGVWHLMTGLPYLVRFMGFGLFSPKTRARGMDLSGVVEAVGSRVTQFGVGDEVYGTCDGSFAEFARVKSERIALKPRNLSFEQAAAVPISGCAALTGLRDAARLERGQRLLVIGAGGGVGSYAVQLGKVFGAHVTAVCSGSKAELARSLGADEVIDYTRESFTDGARQFDVILDTAGRRPIGELRRALSPAGALLLVGGEGGDRFLGGFHRQILAPLRSVGSNQKLIGLNSEERQGDLVTLKEMIEAGALAPVIDRAYPLQDAPEAIRYLERGHARGKVVIRVA